MSNLTKPYFELEFSKSESELFTIPNPDPRNESNLKNPNAGAELSNFRRINVLHYEYNIIL